MEDQRMAMEGLRKELAEVNAKIPGRGEEEDGSCPPFEQGTAAAGPGIGRQAPVGVCKPAGLVHAAVA